MFEELSQELIEISEGMLLEDALTKAEIERMRGELATPEIIPCTFDVTIPGWLWRIDQWGEITFHHKDPENFWGKRKVTKSQFLNKIQDENLMKMFGQWSVQKKGVTKCVFYRDYVDVSGKHRREQFFISVKLKKALR